MIFFTADSHYNHANIIKHCKRPFKSVVEMDETIIERWNSVVKERDDVYHLGDFGFCDPEEYILRLNGRIKFVEGNHDQRLLRWARSRNLVIPQIRKIKIEDITVTLCHFGMRVWHKSHFNMWHLYGHSHGGLDPQGKSFDVGMDKWNFYPVSWTQVKEKMATLPDNFNWVQRLPGYDEETFKQYAASISTKEDDEDECPPEVAK